MNHGPRHSLSDHHSVDVASLKRDLVDHMLYAVGKDPEWATERDWFQATALVVSDRLVERWMRTQRAHQEAGTKRIYYFSMEFLIGRLLTNSLLNLGFRDQCGEALRALGVDPEHVCELEFEAALGNGGLGRLAACFMDSMATLGLPGFGYGIRYEYGMFRQVIEGGRQVEHPDSWLRYGNPWEFPRPEVLHPVQFNGWVVDYQDREGIDRHHWTGTELVMAMAYDTPIPGYGAETVNHMRLWSAKASRDFDLRYFNQGDYIRAVEDKTRSENLSKVLYPSDVTNVGRELRLRQQYFFVSASLQDILRRFLRSNSQLAEFPNQVAIQLNDTHPTIAIPELMRLLMDAHELSWEQAWEITVRTFAYTNHTLLPEALETWPVAMLGNLLPRHLQIIYAINHRFLNQVRHRHPGDLEKVRRMSLIDEAGERKVRMAHLAIVGSHAVNGVAAIHSRLLSEEIFADFHGFFPGRFLNVTNGITPRRWLNQANPRLAGLLNSHIGTQWIRELGHLRELDSWEENPEFREAFRQVKRHNKEDLARRISRHLNLSVSPDALFDVQIKRIHEYKRQLLNVLHVVTLYNRIVTGVAEERCPRVILFAGKAAPGYTMAQLIIKLINDVADVVNNDPRVGDRLKVVFIPNYDVSAAADIIPAADLSEQISLAGTEASGTGNMKLALNGALTIGTLDGANVEICEAVGDENIFIFGLTVAEVEAARRAGYEPWKILEENAELWQVLEMIRSGYFSPRDPDRFHSIIDSLTKGGDRYLLLADYAAYVAIQEQVDRLYRDYEAWTRTAIRNVSRMGYFSSDRAIREYAERIWNIRPAY